MAGGKASGILQVDRAVGKPMKYYLQLPKIWAPSIVAFGGFAGTMFLYFTDWRIFMDKVPIYRMKFKEEE